MIATNSLNIVYGNAENSVNILYDLSFNMQKSEILGIAGESGSGKSVLAKHILGINDKALKKVSGSLIIDGAEIVSEADYKNIRGKKIAMIFQDPLSSLNPAFTIGNQLIETIRLHNKSMTQIEAKARAVKYLEEVEIELPVDRLNAYPHQLSGGMNQRVMIALALASEPELIIADEPTTALDVMIEKQIIDLLLKLNRSRGLSIMFITHDLSLLENIADRVIIVYSGEILEILKGSDLKDNRIAHPYTKALKTCIPNMKNRRALTTIKGSITKNSIEMINCCIFAKRCNIMKDSCKQSKPKLENDVRCFFPFERKTK